MWLSTTDAGAQPIPDRPIWELATWRDAAPSSQPQGQLTSGEDWFYSVTQSRMNGVQDGYTAAGYSSYPDLQATSCRTDCNDVDGCIRATVARITPGGAVEWYRDNGLEGDYFRVVDTSDGGFLAMGRTRDRNAIGYNPGVLSDDSNGQTLICNLPGEAVGPRLMIVSKYTHDGALEWQHTYGAMINPDDHLPGSGGVVQGPQDVAWDAVELPGGGYRVVGCSVTSLDGNNPRAFVMDIDAQGQVLDRQVYGDVNKRSMFMSIARSGGTYVIAGTQYSGPAGLESSRGDVFVIGLGETLGAPEKEAILTPNTPTSHDVGYDVAFGTTGTLVLASIRGCTGGGQCFRFNAGGTGQAVVQRLDPVDLFEIGTTGNALGTVTAFDLYVRLTPLSNGGFALVSTKQPNGPVPGLSPFSNTDAYVARLSASGGLEWDARYDAQTSQPHRLEGDKRQECLYDVAETEDGGLVIAGNNSSNLDDSYVVRFGSTAPTTFPLVDLQHSHLIYPGEVGQPLTTTFTNVVSIDEDSRFDVGPERTLRFAPEQGITVRGRMVATRATLTSTGSGGWGGIYVGPIQLPPTGAPPPTTGGNASTSPDLVLSGTTVSGVRATPGPKGITAAAVRVRDRWASLDDETQVLSAVGAHGVSVTGAARLDVAGQSLIRLNQGFGIVATGGAYVSVDDGLLVNTNTAGGVRFEGYGTQAFIRGGSQVNGNLGIGLVASAQAYARIRAYDTVQGSRTQVSNNRGGPTALGGGSVDGGQCGPAFSFFPNTFANNILGGNYDARAAGGSVVVARRAYWGGRTNLITPADGSSTVTVLPLAPTANTPDATCNSIGRPAGPGLAQSAQRRASADAATDGAGGDLAGRGGPVTAAVVALATEARETAWAGDPDGAFALLQQAAQASLTDDDREAVYGAVGALVAAADTALSVPALVSSLEATAAGSGPDRLWARGALGVAYAVTDRAAEADGLAASLASDGAGTVHAAIGHGLRVRLAVDAADEAGALARLVAFDAVVAPADTAAVEAFASALALVAATFPDADLSVFAGGDAGRGIAGGTDGAEAGRGASAGAEALATETLAARGASVAAYEDALDAYPNPSAGRGTVRVSLATTGSAAVAVYDALGRRVAVLHNGPLAAGPHALPFDASALRRASTSCRRG